MHSFLLRVANAYYQHYQHRITDFTFVFPNRRAGLFFQRYLAEQVTEPLFSPDIKTINECFTSACSLQTDDRLSLLFRLYSIFLQHSKSQESFDSFVYWGEMLLSDFEDVDKYCIDAKQLFTNVTDLKQIDELFNVFTERQIEAIRQFWSNFNPVTEDKTHEEFIATWKILYPVYEQFRRELEAENLATDGMISRKVAEQLKQKQFPSNWDQKQFVFIGFNALNPCEKTLFVELQKAGKADFYWDYDAAELRDPDNQASRYYAENLYLFPSQLAIGADMDELSSKQIELYAVPSAVGQAKQVNAILNTIYPAQNQDSSWIKTAVVLPDESLLLPLLHSLPEQIGKINITMGFPLKSTPASGLIDHIFELQRRMRSSANKCSFYYQNVLNILNHQYIALLSGDEISDLIQQITQNNWIYVEASELHKNEILSAIFSPQNEASTFLPYLLDILKKIQLQWLQHPRKEEFILENDFLYQYYITLNRMQDVLLEKPADISMSLDTMVRLIKQLIAPVTIPFIGEPLDGLQVMGVLEIRGLDFENLIITSFNEGVFPQKSNVNSFIPYNLRKGFNLPTAEYHDSITAYNFYRLLHRARRIFFLYDSRSESGQTGEVSRFIHQLQLHYGINIQKKLISYDIEFNSEEELHIVKSPEVMTKLNRFCSDGSDALAFSASSLNNYIDCPLKFYLTRVEGIQETEDVKENIEADMFGTLFHAVMENLYQPYLGKLLDDTDIDDIFKNSSLIDKEIRKAFTRLYFRSKNSSPMELEGNNLLVASVIRKYVRQVLQADKKYTPFRYLASEKRCAMRFPILNGTQSVNIKGFIDRVDEKNGMLRIVDYKTGSGDLDFRSLDDVFDSTRDKRPKFVLQTFLYGLLYKIDSENKPLAPGIYYIKNVFNNDFSTSLNYKPERNIVEPVNDFSVFEEEFTERLRACFDEIFNPAVPFRQTTNAKNCQYCSFTGICRR